MLRPFLLPIAERNECRAGPGEGTCLLQRTKTFYNRTKKRTKGTNVSKSDKRRDVKFEQNGILFPTETHFAPPLIERPGRFGYNLDTKIKPNCAGCRNLHVRKRV